MDYRDKIMMANICRELYNEAVKITKILPEFEKYDSLNKEDIQNLSDEELQKESNRIASSAISGLVNIEFTLEDYGSDSLIESMFLLSNIPLFRKYTSENIENINVDKSNYFWDNLYLTGLEPMKKDYELLDIYDEYKKKCEFLQIDGLYDLIEKFIDTICNKYNEYMGLKENGLNLKKDKEKIVAIAKEQKENEEREIKEEFQKKSTNNVTVPGSILIVCVVLFFNGYFNGLTLLIAIVSFIWLCVGIGSMANSCKNCGKWNSYELIDEQVLDSYVTTEMKTEYRSGRPHSYPATITKDVILQTYKCKNCGNIKSSKVERSR